MKTRPLLLALAVLVPSLSARADVPPEPGYVESCTVQNQTRPGRECRLCNTYHGNPPDFCSAQMGAGFSQACRSRGASVWDEVWCKDSGGAAPATGTTSTATTGTTTGSPAMTESTGTAAAAPAEDDDCSTAPARALALPALALAAFAFVARRRIVANRR